MAGNAYQLAYCRDCPCRGSMDFPVIENGEACVGVYRQMCIAMGEETNVVGYVKGNGREWIPVLDENSFGDIPEA